MPIRVKPGHFQVKIYLILQYVHISIIEYPQPKSCQVLTHDFQRDRIAFTSAFRVHRPTSVSSNVVHFNMLKDQALSAHYNAFRSVLLQDSTLKTKGIKYLSKYLDNLQRKRTPCLQINVLWLLSLLKAYESTLICKLEVSCFKIRP